MKTEAKIFKALADETRLRILTLLLTGELCVCEVMSVLNLPQSTASRHLAYLKKAGWVLDRRQGIWMYYRLNDKDNSLRGALREIIVQHFSHNKSAQEAVERLTEFRKGQAS